MNCLKCHIQFNTTTHIPHLLPHCGHTLCSSCIPSLISSNFLPCPQCKQINLASSLQDLPKNLAILSFKHQLQKHLLLKTQSAEDNKYCLSHLKQHDYFCFDCHQKGCLNCLINHPKEHKVKSLEETEGQLRQHLQEVIKRAKEMKLSYRLQRMQIEKTELLNVVNEYKVEIGRVFGELKRLCEKKEEDILGFLKSLYDIELIRLLEQQKQIKNYVNKYNQYQTINGSQSVTQLISHYVNSKELFSKNCFDGIQIKTKQEEKLVNQLNRWEMHFNKFKETMVKQIKQIVNVKVQPQSSTVPLKLQVKTVKDQARFYQSKNTVNVKFNNNVNSHNTNSHKIHDVQNIPPPSTKIFKIDIPPPVVTQRLTHRQTTSTLATKHLPHILIYGGYTDQVETSTTSISGIQIYNSPKLYQKYTGCIGHVKFGILSHNNEIFIFGGKVDNKRIDYIFKMSSLKEGFKIVGKMGRAKSGFGYCRVGESFIVCGGNDGGVLGSCEEYQFDGFKRKSLPSLLTERDQLTLTYHNGQLYAIGGYNTFSEISLKSVQLYSFQTSQWQVLSELSHPRRSHSSISLRTGLFVVGGFDGVNYLSGIQRFNDETKMWDEIFHLVQPRCTFSLNECEEGFVVLGGFTKFPDKSCEVCNVREGKSRAGHGLVANRFMHGSVLLGEGWKL